VAEIKRGRRRRETCGPLGNGGSSSSFLEDWMQQYEQDKIAAYIDDVANYAGFCMESCHDDPAIVDAMVTKTRIDVPTFEWYRRRMEHHEQINREIERLTRSNKDKAAA
jgi:hypothetical protein